MAGLPWGFESNQLLLRAGEEFKDDKGKPDFAKIKKKYFPARTERGCKDQYWRLTKEAAKAATADQIDPPSYHELFKAMKDSPMSLMALSNKFDRSPKVIKRKIEEMEEKGYNVVVMRDQFAVQTSTKPQVDPPHISIADLMGTEFNIAVASDWHCGSKDAQPTSLNKFLQYAYEEFDVRHTFVPGDVTDGIKVYRGHLDNLIPESRPIDNAHSWVATEVQSRLADIYAPVLPDHTYYIMGGNHDDNHLRISGLDPIRMLCEKRDDMVYGGYDVWGIPLTEKTYIRLFHGKGGLAYARSYKLQKGIESLAFEALREAMREDMPPIVSMLIAGHWHLTNHTPEPPLHGILAGCFQGQTDFMKTRNMSPHIAGVILQLKVNKQGKISEFAHRPLHFEEIDKDWLNWPVPSIEDPDKEPDDVGLIFSVTGDEPTEK